MNKQKIKQVQIMVLGKASKLTLGADFGKFQEYKRPKFIPYQPYK